MLITPGSERVNKHLIINTLSSIISEFQCNCMTILTNSETQRLVQNVILKLEKTNMVLVKPTMVNQL